jgi:hypothetical protein
MYNKICKSVSKIPNDKQVKIMKKNGMNSNKVRNAIAKTM